MEKIKEEIKYVILEKNGEFIREYSTFKEAGADIMKNKNNRHILPMNKFTAYYIQDRDSATTADWSNPLPTFEDAQKELKIKAELEKDNTYRFPRFTILKSSNYTDGKVSFIVNTHYR